MGAMNELDYMVQKFGEPDGKGKVDVSNCNRTMLAETLHELGYKVGLELGVAQGFYSKIILDKNPQLKRLFLVDIWKVYPGYDCYGHKIKAYEKICKRRLFPYKEKIRYIKKMSMDAVKKFPDGSLDFIFIDAAHDFRHIAEDIAEWTPKVRVGGLVFGHDFKRTAWHNSDVKDVVMAYFYSKKINPWFNFGNGITDPNIGKDNPCWGFIRQESDILKPPRKVEFV